MTGNLSSKWEVTPSVAREMDFSLTVRDNNSDGGQVATDEMKVMVTDLAGPFEVTSQNIVDMSWEVGATENITWDVAGTTSNGVNTSQVNISLSVDGGKSFPMVLASNTPNDGSENITVPDQIAPNCRIMVEAVGNIYYSVNAESFSLGEFVSECVDYDSVDVPKNIPDNSPDGIVSFITISEENVLNGVRVSVNITHPWIADITLILESPQGTLVELISGECFGKGKGDMNVVFDDNASDLVCASSAPFISGIIKPSQELSVLLSESPQGEWKLKVIDETLVDIGFLNNWSLEICTSRLLPVQDYLTNHVMLFPDPSEGIFNVSFQLVNENVQISLFDLLGREIKQLKFANRSDSFNEIIDFTDIASGVYILQIKNGSHFSSKKIKLN